MQSTLNHHYPIRKNEIPEYLHFRKHRRTPEILILGDKGSLIMKNRHQYKPDKVGYHYDNTKSEMGAAFIGIGPAFKQGIILDRFEMVDVYPLMAHLLHIKPNPNNGSLDTFRQALSANVVENEGTNEVDSIEENYARSVFKSRGGSNVSGVIYFKQMVRENY